MKKEVEVQMDLFGADKRQEKKQPKTYAVQKYRLSYVRENTDLGDCKVMSRNDVKDFCRHFLSPLPIEKVCIIALDNGHNIIGFEAIEGATNQCAVYPSNCFRFLLCAGASAFIIAHNHPGGSTRPSEADWKFTERLKKAGELLDVPLLDHLIITETELVSLRDSSRWG